MLNDELLDIALEGLANNKTRVDSIDNTLVGIQDSIKANVALSIEKIDNVSGKLDKVTESFTDELATVLKAIPVPKDGVDGKSITGEPGPKGEPGESIKGKDGIDGIDGKDGVATNGKDGKDGVGVDGSDGKDGIGISSIEADKDSLIFTLDNKEVKQVLLPKISKSSKDSGAVTTGSATAGRQFLSKNRDVDIRKPENDQVLTYKSGKWVNQAVSTTASVPGDAGAITDRTEIEVMFKVAQTTAYKELTYDAGNITNVDIYTNSGKTIKLFSKVIGYNNGNITNVSITDEVNGGTLNKTIAYVGTDISSVTSLYTT